MPKKEKFSLHSVYSPWVGWLSLCLLCVLLGTAVYSHTSPIVNFKALHCTTYPNGTEICSNLGFVILGVSDPGQLQLSYMDIVLRSFNVGAYWFGVLQIFFSVICIYGVWAGVILCWFAKLTSRRRTLILRWISRVVKWCLLGPFTLVIISSTYQTQSSSGDESIFLAFEPLAPGVALYLSIITIMIYVQWVFDMHYRADVFRYQKTHQSKPAKAPPEATCGCQSLGIRRVHFDERMKPSYKSENGDDPLLLQFVFLRGRSQYKCSMFGIVFCVFCIVTMFALGCLGIVVPIVNARMVATIAPGNATVVIKDDNLSIISLGSAQVSATILQGNAQAWVTLINSVFYFLLAAVIPYVVYSMFLVSLLMPLNKWCKKQNSLGNMYEATSTLSLFAAMDVVLLAVLTMIDYIDKTPDVLTEGRNRKVNFGISLLPETLVLLVSVLLFWIFEYLFMFMSRRLFRMHVGGREKRTRDDGMATCRSRQEGNWVAMLLRLAMVVEVQSKVEKSQWDFYFDLADDEILETGEVLNQETKSGGALDELALEDARKSSSLPPGKADNIVLERTIPHAVTEPIVRNLGRENCKLRHVTATPNRQRHHSDFEINLV